MSAKKLYAFPISKVFHLDLAGEEHFLGLRFRWNTGETEIAWDQPGTFKMALIFEEPIPAKLDIPAFQIILKQVMKLARTDFR